MRSCGRMHGFSYLHKNLKDNFSKLFTLQHTEAMARKLIAKCWKAMASDDPRRASLQDGVDMTKLIPA